MVELTLRILFSIIGLSFFVLVIEFVRRRILIEKYALAWVAVAGITLLFGIFPGTFVTFAAILGMHHLSFVLLLLLLFLLLFSLHMSIVVTRLSKNLEKLSRKGALFEAKKGKQ